MRIHIFGDSLAYGEWDSLGGWAARLRMYVDDTLNIGKWNYHHVYGLGLPGETTGQLKNRLERELPIRINPDEENIVIIQSGANDVNHMNGFTGEQIPKEDFVNNYADIIDVIKKYTQSFIILGMLQIDEEKIKKIFSENGTMLLNEEVKEYAQLLKGFCVRNDYPFIDLYALVDPSVLIDGLHPDDEGHIQIFQAVKDFLISKGYVS